MTIHREHRRRVKNRFLGEGMDHFDEVHALELLLFYAIPQGDVNPLAHRLLDHFGGLHQVLTAPPEQLMQVTGVGEHTAILLGLVKGISQKYLIGHADSNAHLNTLEDHIVVAGRDYVSLVRSNYYDPEQCRMMV